MGIVFFVAFACAWRRRRRLSHSLSVRPQPRRVLSRTRSFSGRPLVRRAHPGVFDRLRAGNRRLQRPPRHALEDFGDSARRLRQVFRRRQCRQHAGHGAPRRHGASERAHSFLFQRCAKRAAIVVAGPLANFVLAIVIFAGVFMLYGKPTMSARVERCRPAAPPPTAGFKPGDWSSRSTAAPSTTLPTCSESSATAPARP